jgi:hypothetical protein
LQSTDILANKSTIVVLAISVLGQDNQRNLQNYSHQVGLDLDIEKSNNAKSVIPNLNYLAKALFIT